MHTPTYVYKLYTIQQGAAVLAASSPSLVEIRDRLLAARREFPHVIYSATKAAGFYETRLTL